MRAPAEAARDDGAEDAQLRNVPEDAHLALPGVRPLPQRRRLDVLVRPLLHSHDLTENFSVPITKRRDGRLADTSRN